MFDTLETIGNASAAWRATRKNKGKGQRLPDELKRRAVGLLDDGHSARKIARVLGLSDARVVKQWRSRAADAPSLQPINVATRPPQSFIEVVMPCTSGPSAESPNLSAAQVQLELVAGQGCVLRLHGRLDTAVVCALAESMFNRAGAQP